MRLHIEYVGDGMMHELGDWWSDPDVSMSGGGAECCGSSVRGNWYGGYATGTPSTVGTADVTGGRSDARDRCGGG